MDLEDLEIVFNELSLRMPAANVQTARQWMSEFINTVLAVKPPPGVKRKLRAKSNFSYSLLAPDYRIVQWRNDPNVDLEARRFLKTLQDKNDPPLPDIADPGIEVRYQGEQAIGIEYAFVFNALAVSLRAEPCWDYSRLELEVRRLDENEDLIDERLEIFHVSCSNHVQEHTDWINNRIRARVRDGLELWNRKDELFPNLIFCEVVGEQVQSLRAENPMLRLVKNRLSELEDYCKIWTDEAFEPKSLRNVSPESQVTLQNPKYSKERTFLCPDGKQRVFSWHAKLSLGWRIYFFPNEQRKMIIGYVGCHLRTVKYSN